MPEPSLSEISNMRIDPELSGVAPNVVNDNSRLVQQLNENGRFHAQQVANKYNQYLQNKSDIFKNLGNIEGLETLPEDKPILNKQAADIFTDILKDPSVVTGGAGYGKVMEKMSKFKNDAMASKMTYLNNKMDNTLFAAHPAMDTPENRAMQKANNALPFEQRKTPIYSTPPILDQKSLAESIFTKNPFVKSTYSKPVTENGIHYLQSGTIINPKAFLGAWDQIVKGGATDKNNKDLVNAIKFQYDNDPNKSEYEKDGGGIEQYWQDKGKQYLDAYTQGATQDKETGNFIINPKNVSDPAYTAAQNLELNKQKLAQKTQHDKDQSNRDWTKIGLTKEKMGKEKGEDISDARATLNQLSDVFKNATPYKPVGGYNPQYPGQPFNDNVMQLNYLPFLKKYNLIDKNGKATGEILWDKSTDKYSVVKLDQNGVAKSSIPIDQRILTQEVLNQQTKGVKSNSASSKIVEDLMSKYGGSLSKLTEAINDPKNQLQDEQPKKSKEQSSKPTMKNKANYYYDESNKKSQKGNVVTYKDGTEWEIKNGKFIQIK